MPTASILVVTTTRKGVESSSHCCGRSDARPKDSLADTFSLYRCHKNNKTLDNTIYIAVDLKRIFFNEFSTVACSTYSDIDFNDDGMMIQWMCFDELTDAATQLADGTSGIRMMQENLDESMASLMTVPSELRDTAHMTCRWRW